MTISDRSSPRPEHKLACVLRRHSALRTIKKKGEENTHWHKTYPSLRASPKCLRSRSSPPAPSPLEPALLRESCVELDIKDDPLFPHTLSNLASDLSLTSTSSYTRGSKPDCEGGLSISLIKRDEAVRTSSRCSEEGAVVASKTFEALMERIWERLGE